MELDHLQYILTILRGDFDVFAAFSCGSKIDFSQKLTEDMESIRFFPYLCRIGLSFLKSLICNVFLQKLSSIVLYKHCILGNVTRDLYFRLGSVAC